MYLLTCVPNEDSGPEVTKLFSCSTQLSMKLFRLINLRLLTIAKSFLLNIAEHVNCSANKYENVGIFIFISRENFMLSWVEHKKIFITSGTDQPVHSPSLINVRGMKLLLPWLSKKYTQWNSDQTACMCGLIWTFAVSISESMFSDNAAHRTLNIPNINSENWWKLSYKKSIVWPINDVT